MTVAGRLAQGYQTYTCATESLGASETTYPQAPPDPPHLAHQNILVRGWSRGLGNLGLGNFAWRQASLTLIHAMNGLKGWAPGLAQAETLALAVAKTVAEDNAAQSLTSWDILRVGGVGALTQVILRRFTYSPNFQVTLPPCPHPCTSAQLLLTSRCTQLRCCLPSGLSQANACLARLDSSSCYFSL